MVYKATIAIGLLIAVYGCTSKRINAPDMRQPNTKTLSFGFTHGYWPNASFFAANNTNTLRKLRIYVHGDGLPWLANGRIARDPSPAYELTWQLLKQDSTPAILLGRPCYFGAAKLDARCSPEDWTSHRYSEKVVVSMSEAVQAIYFTFRPSQIELTGYSGGGTLALLIADKLSNYSKNKSVSATEISVTTIAANLDIDAWTAHHRYSPLTGSLNPTDNKSLANIRQRHFCGADDKNIPAALNEKYFNNLALDCHMVAANHKEGWIEQWVTLLNTPFSNTQP